MDDTGQLMEALLTAEARGDTARCIALFEAAGSVPPAAYEVAARAYLLQEAWEKAVRCAEAGLRREPPHPAFLRYIMAKAYMAERRFVRVAEVCREAFDRFEAEETMTLEIYTYLLPTYADACAAIGDPRASALAFQYSRLESEPIGLRRKAYSTGLMALAEQDMAPAEVLRVHQGYNDLFEGVEPYASYRHAGGAKLRIGYISPDFNRHVMAQFLWPFLAAYDRKHFAVYAYHVGAADELTAQFRPLADGWRALAEADTEAVARQIHDDGIDILVDLAGHTTDSGLPVLAYRPAPIEVSGLGYMTTTGLRGVDYFLTDRYADPVGSGDAYFSEKLVRLQSQFCCHRLAEIPASAGTPAGASGSILFASFNHYRKITDEVLAAWRGILARVPGSRLLVKSGNFGDPDMVAVAQARFEAAGMPMERVILEPPSADYLLRYLAVDIALDTSPYNGGGTTVDALYMGVPVVTRYVAERHSARFALSLLANLGLAELAAPTWEAYVETAVLLAGDRELLDMLHRGLRRRMETSPLMDEARYMRSVESAYRQMYAIYQAGQPPRAITVAETV